ncbi:MULTISPECIES: NAD(+) diphosphatase [Bosea]|jgi:NAD+ diphosphatase|uniref:NAD(+) diphosphatase n=1 Tax=Bosea TaxID=85413 RepID=UPI00214FCED7|nr:MULTISPECIES: NAD(+) diphosphatase [Bosea]MCR4522775.1 NAD(+) diphosphatase [Bosea sp. 47.2.35]MDR6826546.1 NAD+ diphosphatase [Bosea robiniae]MDR6893256.1 NAD+ diphosphatase [Bosea sp. BE109]MDR7137045.1 NAD+ diphosphatase [Bosea sp. BE168]MDR7173744.1 NAD+ diphosphatase [Bosea sp. BE271]
MNDALPRRERSSLTGFAINRLDRREDLRNKPDAVTALRHRSDTRIAVVAGETPILKRLDGEALTVWFSHGEAEILGPAAEEIFMGMTEDGTPRFGRLLDKALAEPLKERSELFVTDLRSVALKRIVPEDEVGPLGEAKAVLDWHARHRFCAQCGGSTVAGASGWRRECTSCGAMHFPRTDPVVIMLVTRGDACLLARQARFAPGMYSCIAGFVEPGETLEDAVRRESWEEAGLRVGNVRYLASQPWPFPSSIMMGCIAEALGDEITLDMTELEEGRWFPRAEVLQMLEGKHPDGLACPQHIAIANTLVRAWALEGERI